MQTRSDHLKLVLKYLDGSRVGRREPLKELEQFLQDRAMEHDTARRCRGIRSYLDSAAATA